MIDCNNLNSFYNMSSEKLQVSKPFYQGANQLIKEDVTINITAHTSAGNGDLSAYVTLSASQAVPVEVTVIFSLYTTDHLLLLGDCEMKIPAGSTHAGPQLFSWDSPEIKLDLGAEITEVSPTFYSDATHNYTITFTP